MRLVRAWKATLVIHLVILVFAGALWALAEGWRVPIGRFGVSMLSDPHGRPFVLIDHPSNQGWLVAVDARNHRLETWSGTVRIQ